MLCQNLIQQFGIIMERESNMLYQSLPFLLLNPLKAIQLLIDFIMVLPYIMKQIIIKIRNTGLSPLFLKYPVPILLVFKNPA